MRTATYALIGVATLGLAACDDSAVWEGPAAAYLPQGVGFYGNNGDLTNGAPAGQPYIIQTERRTILRRGTTPADQPIELVPVEPIEDLGLGQ
ncbi:hypothetical protein [Nereida sp. MMG025]|uniref:hypothetical protein n=1 Tax=Nereida sp. MMG025 TaxID=2909981 RepID=UPI001F17A5D8|nr:hypothetical protein [Nereida sp. MMG025]MCF6443949.1 hypothetical protein [Nereida sp. MMG025]